MPTQQNSRRDRIVAVAIVALIASLALFTGASEAEGGQPDRYQFHGDMAAAEWELAAPEGQTSLSLQVMNGWEQTSAGQDHVRAADSLIVLWTHVGTDRATGRRAETSWEAIAPLESGFSFDESLRSARLDAHATADGYRCLYDEEGAGECQTLGTARVHLDLHWDGFGSVTRDHTAYKWASDDMLIHIRQSSAGRAATVSGTITGDVDLLPADATPALGAALFRQRSADRYFTEFSTEQ